MKRPSPQRIKVSENKIQIAILAYLRAVLHKSAIVLHIPNEGQRSKATSGLLSQLGLLPGAADLLVIAPGPLTFFIECKTDIGRISEEQFEFRDACIGLSVPYFIARSIDDVQAALADLNIKTKDSRR